LVELHNRSSRFMLAVLSHGPLVIKLEMLQTSYAVTFMVQAVFTNIISSTDLHLATYTLTIHVTKIEGLLIAQQSQKGNCLLMDSVHSEEVDKTVLSVAAQHSRVQHAGDLSQSEEGRH
jgi:hypothetical protein